MLRHSVRAHLAVFCLAAAGLLCVESPLQAQGGQGPDFKLILINGQAPDPYLNNTSPTDGDILDREFLTRDVILTFRADYGEAVVCTDRLNAVLATAAREACASSDDPHGACFTLAIDTRRLPNGPNSLFFTLYDAYPSPGVKPTRLAELKFVFNVLNPHVEVDARAADAVRLRLDAGVADPAQVKNYRYALFAGRVDEHTVPLEERLKTVLGDYLPMDGQQAHSIWVPVGPNPVRIFPRGTSPVYAEWPNASSPYLYFSLSRAALVELSGFPVPKPVYVAAAVWDGKTWQWTAVCEVALAAAGDGKIPAPSQK